MNDPFEPFECWLKWLETEQGKHHRKQRSGKPPTDYDLLMLIPTPPGQTIFTMGDLRNLVAAGQRLSELESRTIAPASVPVEE